MGVNCWVSNHNQEVFGLDADEFRPERWLQASEKGGASVLEQSWIPFGLGSRTCIGKNISLLEMTRIIPILVKNFDFDFFDKDGRTASRDYMPTENKWFVKTPHFYARLKGRENS